MLGLSAKRQRLDASKVRVILGAQWGDEGKGKVVDMLATEADIVCRCQGGSNAGHSVFVNDNYYNFHLLPVGIINPKCTSVIGNGVVIHLPSLFKELEEQISKGLSDWENRLIISDKAHIVFDFHQQVDGFQEQENTNRGQGLGTTKKGIGPTYSSKVTRNGIRIGELLGNFTEFSKKFDALVHMYRKMFPNMKVDVEEELKKYEKYAELIRPCVKETVHYLDKRLRDGKKIIVEGANASMLDIDFGTYPYVTSSNSSVGSVCTGLGIAPIKVGEVIGVVKAYTTRIGDGPFPTELNDKTGEILQKQTQELSFVTKRKRRCGWLDLFQVKYTNMFNCYTCLCLTKLDILDRLSELKIGIGYNLRGKKINHFPSTVADLTEVKVDYITMPGWMTSTKHVRCFKDLPVNAQLYVKKIEDTLEVPIRWIGVGKERDSIITLF